eukprot:s1034_g19.t1
MVPIGNIFKGEAPAYQRLLNRDLSRSAQGGAGYFKRIFLSSQHLAPDAEFCLLQTPETVSLSTPQIGSTEQRLALDATRLAFGVGSEPVLEVSRTLVSEVSR